MIPADLQPRIQRLLDGELTAEEMISLENDLRENEESLEVYRELAALHSDLEVLHAGQATLGKSSVVPIDLVIKRQRSRTFKFAMYATAAVIMLSLLMLQLMKAPETPLASFRTTPDATFSLAHDTVENDAPKGQILVVGSKLHLTKGLLESEFENGVRLVIEAPCVLRVLADNRVAVDKGRAWFEVPQEAIGFTVETKELIVVDLGTSFGVDSAPSTGHDEVHVTQGAVEVRLKAKEISETLREGEARKINDLGLLEEIKVDSKRFVNALPANEGLIAHWCFEDSASNGYTRDSSGNGHTGKLGGNATISEDPLRGKVLSLSGLASSNDMVDIDAVKNIPDLLAHRGLTLSAWIKRNKDATAGGRYSYIVSLGASEENPLMTLGINSTNRCIAGYVEGDGGKDQVRVYGDTPVINGEWTHIAITYDRLKNKAITYVNGVAQASPTDISLAGDGDLDWSFAMIGRTPDHRDADSRFFGGLIDDVRIYDNPLSPKEITELMK